MIIWNFRTPETILASLIWNFCEYFEIRLGKFAAVLFGVVIGSKKQLRN